MEKKYFIYSYLFPDKYVYVGLTNDMVRRDLEHRRKGDVDAVYKHSVDHSVEIPEPIVLESDLNCYAAQSKEENWIEYYKSEGYFILNKAKTGLFVSSLGGVNKLISQNNICGGANQTDLSVLYGECLHEAKKYRKLIDFRRKSSYYYGVSLRHKWVSNFEWLERSTPTNKGSNEFTLDEIKLIASKYKTKTEFSLNEKNLYLKCLESGIIDDLFKKNNKTKIKDDESITDEYLIGLMLEYNTKTEFAKNNSRLYNISRIRGLLKYFPKRQKENDNEKRKEEIESDVFFSSHKNLKYCPKYPKIIFDLDTCCLYQKRVKKITKMKYSYDRYGVLWYKIKNKNVHITSIINDFIFDGKYNLIKIDDFENIQLDKIFYDNIDMGVFKELKHATGFFINQKGEIYSSDRRTLLTLTELDGYNIFNGCRVDRLVYKYFGDALDGFKKINIIHIDGNTRNDNLDNLEVELENSNIRSKQLFSAYFIGNTHEIMVGGKYYLGLIKDEKIVKEIKKEILKKIHKNPNIGSWVNSYKKLEFKEWQKKDEELEMLALRVKSTGCYYSKVHKLWKSKIFYENKEYSLGYFDNFESGKLLYDEAVVYIKHGMFEDWYCDIESHRQRVKRYVK